MSTEKNKLHLVLLLKYEALMYIQQKKRHFLLLIIYFVFPGTW